MGKEERISIARSKPLILQSKRLCFSCIYLFTTLFLTLFITLSPTNKCRLFRYGSFDPIQSSLFSYPISYGEHKHPIPTYRHSCSSPVFFSDYSIVLSQIRQSVQDWVDLPLRYMQGKGSTFGGNFSLEKRLSFLDQLQHGSNEFPCGFFKPFPITPLDEAAMRTCDSVVVVSAIFGDHDKIRQPKGVGSKTLSMVCFFMFVDDLTLKGLQRHNLISEGSNDQLKVGVWRLVNVSSLYENPAMNGVIPKYLVHRLFPNAKYSIWVDAKLQLVVDPLLLIHSLVVREGVDMAISRHPSFTHTMEEAMATTRWRKWLDVEGIRVQMESYCQHGLRPWSPNKLPYPSDVPDTALILRKHGVANNAFSCMLFNELDGFNHRDQLAFAFVRDKLRPKININMFDSEVFERIVVEFRHNLKQVTTATTLAAGSKKRRASMREGLGKCHAYFMEMWGEPELSHD